MKEVKSEWTLRTLRTYFLALLKAHDDRYRQEFDNQKLAVKDALAATKELTTAAFNSSEKAIVKAENSQTVYNQGHNDLSRKMEGQYALMIPKAEHNNELKAVKDTIESIKVSTDKRLDRIDSDIRELRESRSGIEGKGNGANALWGYLIGGIMALAAIVTVIIVLIKQSK